MLRMLVDIFMMSSEQETALISTFHIELVHRDILFSSA